MNTNKSYII